MRVTVDDGVHGLHELGLVELLTWTAASLTTPSIMTVAKCATATRLIDHSTELRIIGCPIILLCTSTSVVRMMMIIIIISFVLEAQLVLLLHIAYLGLLLEHDLGQLQLVLHFFPIALTYRIVHRWVVTMLIHFVVV